MQYRPNDNFFNHDIDNNHINYWTTDDTCTHNNTSTHDDSRTNDNNDDNNNDDNNNHININNNTKRSSHQRSEMRTQTNFLSFLSTTQNVLNFVS